MTDLLIISQNLHNSLHIAFNVDKCTVIRAIAIDKWGRKSDEVSATYFVGFDKKTGYDNVEYVSLYSNPKNFFDYKDGIYVTGKTFEIFINKTRDKIAAGADMEESDINRAWWFWPANYRNKGSDWEKDAVVEIDDNISVLAGGVFENCLHGSTSRSRKETAFFIPLFMAS